MLNFIQEGVCMRNICMILYLCLFLSASAFAMGRSPGDGQGGHEGPGGHHRGGGGAPEPATLVLIIAGLGAGAAFGIKKYISK